MIRKLLYAALLTPLTLSTAFADPAAPKQETVTPVFQHEIPNIPGKSLVSVVVNYAPGAKSVSHHHARSAFIYAYVLKGEIRSQVDNQPVKVYKTGEVFFEDPGAQHKISENASKTKPASLLAVLVVDSNDQPLTTPDAK